MATLSMDFTESELNTTIDEFNIEALGMIQSMVEDDSHLKHLDYSYMDSDEVAEIVADYNDLLDF